MPDTRITKKRLKNHLHYGKWIYAGIAVLAFFLTDLAYTMTEYRPDAYHRVTFELVGNTILNDSGLDAVAESAQKAISAEDEMLEQVSFANIAYSGDPETDIYGAQKYAVMLAAQEGDIYFLTRTLMEQLVAQGGALPLDEYIAAGILSKDGAVKLPETDDDDQPTGNEYYYAVSAADLGLMQDDQIGYDNRDKYAVIFASCVNPDTAARVLANVIDQLTGPAPDSEFAQSLGTLAETDVEATAAP